MSAVSPESCSRKKWWSERCWAFPVQHRSNTKPSCCYLRLELKLPSFHFSRSTKTSAPHFSRARQFGVCKRLSAVASKQKPVWQWKKKHKNGAVLSPKVDERRRMKRRSIVRRRESVVFSKRDPPEFIFHFTISWRFLKTFRVTSLPKRRKNLLETLILFWNCSNADHKTTQFKSLLLQDFEDCRALF